MIIKQAVNQIKKLLPFVNSLQETFQDAEISDHKLRKLSTSGKTEVVKMNNLLFTLRFFLPFIFNKFKTFENYHIREN